MFCLSTLHILPLDPAQIRHCLLKGVKVGHPILTMKLPTVADRTPRVDPLVSDLHFDDTLQPGLGQLRSMKWFLPSHRQDAVTL